VAAAGIKGAGTLTKVAQRCRTGTGGKGGERKGAGTTPLQRWVGARKKEGWVDTHGGWLCAWVLGRTNLADSNGKGWLPFEREEVGKKGWITERPRTEMKGRPAGMETLPGTILMGWARTP